mmetsp:Transcript_20464/g.59293  ORF Transcript_20464/g.59293 Transcript_20464/m.59293 type:complete len:281 (-) Transcript_20464:261-1103(-)
MAPAASDLASANALRAPPSAFSASAMASSADANASVAVVLANATASIAAAADPSAVTALSTASTLGASPGGKKAAERRGGEGMDTPRAAAALVNSSTAGARTSSTVPTAPSWMISATARGEGRTATLSEDDDPRDLANDLTLERIRSLREEDEPPPPPPPPSSESPFADNRSRMPQPTRVVLGEGRLRTRPTPPKSARRRVATHRRAAGEKGGAEEKQHDADGRAAAAGDDEDASPATTSSAAAARTAAALGRRGRRLFAPCGVDMMVCPSFLACARRTS